ncbi:MULTISPECIES: hypothetical protein [Mesorhizobium]|uniref:Uncharacterized protein n=1 Tax=Rhizobium loti TaxID=381 RepID=A0A6M7U190_RHILI|nr:MULTISPECIES: hypothetical protein [Mesorhizobium]KRB23260.1 hypothetical protein ASE05_11505 [Mesorhizobium sp. Root172]OBQ66601.1 hypothetical protein A8145_29680 [Mesorhizobium loti]QKC70366.1 hypothetical protein EB815_15405 [Mesorhizobium loti]QKC89341.1 hypothetical protein EB230_13570 [Mesorhizobium sp. NZP2234]
MDRFEILNEPTGTYSIFDRFTELPATVGGRTFIGLYRHEVPLALLAAMDAFRPGAGSMPPSLTMLGCWRQRNGLKDRQLDGLQA